MSLKSVVIEEINDTEQLGEKKCGLTITILFAYCISGTAMTLLNKQAVTVFPNPNLILFIQVSSTISFLFIGMLKFENIFGPIPTMTKTVVVEWVPSALLFIAMVR